MRLVLATACRCRWMPTLLAISAATLSLIACGKNVTDVGGVFCFDNTPSCGSGSGGGGSAGEFKIIGFPYDKMGTDSWGQLVPGDSVTLYLFGGPAGVNPSIVLVVAWTVSDTAVARITAGTDGRGTLVAKAPGVFGVKANGPQYIESCDTNNFHTCFQVLGLRVVAPPAP